MEVLYITRQSRQSILSFLFQSTEIFPKYMLSTVVDVVDVIVVVVVVYFVGIYSVCQSNMHVSCLIDIKGVNESSKAVAAH